MQGLYWQKRIKQRNLFNKIEDRPFDTFHEVTWIIGDFFEELAVKQIGGKCELEDPTKRCNERGSTAPDLANWKRNLLYEVKGASRYAFKLFISQIDRYKKLSEASFPWDKPTVYYVLCGHNVQRGIVDKYKTELNLLNALCKNVDYMVVLPLEIICRMRMVWKIYDYSKIGWPLLIQVKRKQVKEFLYNPSGALEWIGCDPNEFNVRHEWSRKCKVVNWMVSEFPIVFIWRDGQEPPKIWPDK